MADRPPAWMSPDHDPEDDGRSPTGPPPGNPREGFAPPPAGPPPPYYPPPQAPPHGQPASGAPQYGPPQAGPPQYGQAPYGQAPYDQPGYGPQPGPAPYDGLSGGWGAPPPGMPGAPVGPGGWSNRGPGIVPLRPLGLSDIYDGAIRAIRANPKTMVGFSAVAIAVITLIGAVPQAIAVSKLLSSPFVDPERAQNVELADFASVIGSGGLALLVGVLQFVLATIVVSGLLIVAVNGAVRGRALAPAELWSICRGRLLRLVGLALVVLFSAPLVVLVAMLPGIVVVFLPNLRLLGVILLVLGALVGIGLFMALYFGYWAIAAPALLLEGLGVFAALRRSRRLVRGHFWRVFGIGLLTALITYVVRQIFTVPFSLVGAAVVGFQSPSTGFTGALIQLLIADIGTIVAGAVLYPFAAGVAALLYLDLRMRREGLDVELIRQ